MLVTVIYNEIYNLGSSVSTDGIFAEPFSDSLYNRMTCKGLLKKNDKNTNTFFTVILFFKMLTRYNRNIPKWR